MTSVRPSPPHSKEIDHIEREEEHMERLLYMSAEELKSAKEVYSVAVIDIEISVGIRNIHIGRSKKLVVENIQYSELIFRARQHLLGEWKDEIRFRFKQTKPTI